jgi:OOP family OmpA-OmpF porin
MGGPEHNLSLSLDRARVVADDLAGRGVDKARLKIQGFGSTYPLASNDTEEGRAMNRRTELILSQ